MALMPGGILRSVGIYGHEGTYGYMFWCPGCDFAHHVNTVRSPDDREGKQPVWGFNGNTERPTFTPSILLRTHLWTPPVTHENYKEFEKNPWPQTKVDHVCHTFVTDGRIQFLSDCTHKLANQTVNLPQWPEEEDE